MAKNDPFIHKSQTPCVLCVLRGEFLQWTQSCNTFITLLLVAQLFVQTPKTLTQWPVPEMGNDLGPTMLAKTTP